MYDSSFWGCNFQCKLTSLWVHTIGCNEQFLDLNAFNCVMHCPSLQWAATLSPPLTCHNCLQRLCFTYKSPGNPTTQRLESGQQGTTTCSLPRDACITLKGSAHNMDTEDEHTCTALCTGVHLCRCCMRCLYEWYAPNRPARHLCEVLV